MEGGNSYLGYALLDDINGQMHQQDMDDDEDFEASSDEETEGEEDGETVGGIGLDGGPIIWNEPRQGENILLDTNKTAEILNVMNNFKLPPTSIPTWAKEIPEDQWKNDLLQKIRLRQAPSNITDDPESSSSNMDSI